VTWIDPNFSRKPWGPDPSTRYGSGVSHEKFFKWNTVFNLTYVDLLFHVKQREPPSSLGEFGVKSLEMQIDSPFYVEPSLAEILVSRGTPADYAGPSRPFHVKQRFSAFCGKLGHVLTSAAR
jgi:hypothetical protein